MKTPLILALLLVLALSAPALEITTTDGVRVDGGELRFTHADGAARIPFAKLSPDGRKFFTQADIAGMKARAEADAAKAELARKTAAEAAQRAVAERQQATLAAEAERIKAVEESARLLAAQKAAAAKARAAEEAAQAKADAAADVAAKEERKAENLKLAGQIFGGIFLLLVYLLPTIIAYSNGARNAGAIFLVNLLFAWTVVIWIAAFIWACVDARKPDTRHRKICLHCREWIHEAASVCPHCQRDYAQQPRVPRP